MSRTYVVPMETIEKSDEYFRFGQDAPPSILRYMMERSPYANRLTEGAMKAAIGNGFDVVDMEGKPLDWNDALHKILDPNYKYVILAGKYERGISKSVLHWFDAADSDKIEGSMVLRAFHADEYDMSYNKNGGIPTKFECTELTVDGQQEDHVTEGDDLFFCYEIINRPTSKQGQGRSFLERCFDELWGLSSLNENAVYFAIKHGSGLIYLEISEDKLSDTTTKNKIAKFLKHFAPNGVYMVPKFNDIDPELQPELKELTGQQIDFISLRDLLLGGVSTATGFPREVLLGSELGLRSAETNQSAYYAILQEIQEEYRPVMRWLVKTICRANDGLTQYENAEFKIEYRKRQTQDDESEMKVLLDKSSILETLSRNNINIDSILKLLDWEDLEVDEPEPVPQALQPFQDGPPEEEGNGPNPEQEIQQ